MANMDLLANAEGGVFTRLPLILSYDGQSQTSTKPFLTPTERDDFTYFFNWCPNRCNNSLN